jgi:predicted O-methyltransferase YrrM
LNEVDRLLFVGGSWAQSKIRIDLILVGMPDRPFAWHQREGWVRALTELGLLNQIYWVWDSSAVIDHLLQSLRQTSADFVLIMCGDYHQYHLHNTPEKQDYWGKLKIPVVCHCCEKIFGGPFTDSEQRTRSALETFDAFLYSDELCSQLFQQSGKHSLWIPRYVDETIFTGSLPFEKRRQRIFFEGRADNFGIDGAYEQHSSLVERIKNNPAFDFFGGFKPSPAITKSAEIKAGYCFVLNTPANCPGYSVSLYEALACGCVVFQYELPRMEKRSLALFKPGCHFLTYDPNDIEGFIAQAENAVGNWRDFERIAEQGREECLAKHTIKKRVGEILGFLETNWSQLSKRANQSGVLSDFRKATVKTDNFAAVKSAVERIEGLLVPGQEEFLFNKVKSLPEDAVIVEIGAYQGRSTVAMGYACAGTDRKIYCIDTWNGNDSDFDKRGFFRLWRENITKNGLFKYVVPLQGYSNDVLSRWEELTGGKKIDFIFIDGSHQYPDVLKDFKLSYPLVKEGGWIAFHDVGDGKGWPGPYRVWHQVAKNILTNHSYSSTLACGQKKAALPGPLPVYSLCSVEEQAPTGTVQSQKDSSLLSTSELSKVIAPQIKDDEFYWIIQDIAARPDVKTILEIGSSNGSGSTEAIVRGMQSNPNNPRLFCIEISKPRFRELQKRYADNPDVSCYNVSSVPLDKFPSAQQVIDFHSRVKTSLSSYPLKRVLGWLQQDIEYVQKSGVFDKGIERIKEENNIKCFDMVLIDGSEFTGEAELGELYGARYVLLDDINGFKNYHNFKRLTADQTYCLDVANWSARNGFAVFKREHQSLTKGGQDAPGRRIFAPVGNRQSDKQNLISADSTLRRTNTNYPRFSIGMIVLNAELFLQTCLESIYDFAYEILIVEGACPQARWDANSRGTSRDRTLEIIQSFTDPDNKIKLVASRAWDHKDQMVNAYIPYVSGDYLFQVDSDEIWNKVALENIRRVLSAEPDITCLEFNPLQFWHNFETVLVGGHWEEPFMRIFRFEPGARWQSHEPPILLNPRGQAYNNIKRINLTDKYGVTFFHYSYVTEQQARWKWEFFKRYDINVVPSSDESTRIGMTQDWFEKVWLAWRDDPQGVENKYGTSPGGGPAWGPKGRTEPYHGPHPQAILRHPLWTKQYFVKV